MTTTKAKSAAPGHRCPRCKGDQLQLLKYQGEHYVQCGQCKYWSTKAKPEDPTPGGFLRVN